MIRPSFSNLISITGNKSASEYVIHFSHTYPATNENGEHDHTETECVAGVVLNRDMAVKLETLLHDILNPKAE